jgi:Cysteine-rich secretory protein family
MDASSRSAARAASDAAPAQGAGTAHDAGPSATGTGTPVSADAGACERWTADRTDLSEGTWTGSIATCDAGDIGPPGRANALKLLNLYRFLAGMPAVKDDPGWDSEAQQCALMQSANGLSHSLTTSAKCYSAAGADGSQRSDLSGGPGVQAIDGYMQDYGNASTMGHRRWILNNQLGPVGLGSAVASCFMNVGGTGNAAKPFVAWPPPGQVPYAALVTTTADMSGWTIQSDTINLNGGTVTVKDGAQTVQVTQSSLPAGYGSTYAIRFAPMGWQSQAGHDYAVTVSGTSVAYTVQVVACP